ncbi:RNA polymerase sigma factor [Actinoplanes sp. NPDC049265]|uniref:RNA polymerase sigma factor n=1 Tax=Actinoplanes sp. NPDC049265 TaxID=3363902 RepID=UPI003723CB5A
MAAPPAGERSPDVNTVAWFEHVLVPDCTPALRRYVRRLLPGDEHRADDIVQETLLRAWRNVAVLAEARSPQAWLSRVARNLVIDWVRRHAARPHEVDEDLWAVEQPADERYDTALDRAVLVGALQRLPPIQREILILVHYQDRTHTDVASALGVPAGTVKSRVHYATRELRRVLGDAGVTGLRF